MVIFNFSERIPLWIYVVMNLSERKIVFWQGVFDGVTGIVRKPIEGAQKEGVEGFFKGTKTLNITVIENQL